VPQRGVFGGVLEAVLRPVSDPTWMYLGAAGGTMLSHVIRPKPGVLSTGNHAVSDTPVYGPFWGHVQEGLSDHPRVISHAGFTHIGHLGGCVTMVPGGC